MRGVRHHMGPRCPYCHQSQFTYRALVGVHPAAHVIPEKIVCPSCHAELRVTAMSRLTGGIAFFATMVTIALLPSTMETRWETWELLLAISAGFILYSFEWVFIVRLKPWTPHFQYWLPKSRVVGYSVYLLVPVAVIALILYLAVHFRWGL